MRLQDYSSFFRPEEFEAMTVAYDAAWRHLRTMRPTLTVKQIHILQKNLAQIILASACNGNRDVVRLKENRIARGFGATAPSTRNASYTASSRRRFGHVSLATSKRVVALNALAFR